MGEDESHAIAELAPVGNVHWHHAQPGMYAPYSLAVAAVDDAIAPCM